MLWPTALVSRPSRRETRVQDWSRFNHLTGVMGSGGCTTGGTSYHIKGAGQQTPPTPIFYRLKAGANNYG